MANVFEDRDNYTIPQELIQEYHWHMDMFLDDATFRHVCTLIYPPRVEECPNCFRDPQTGKSSSVYKTGGPIPFDNFTMCPLCGGIGRQSTEVTDTIYLRIYYKPKDFINMGIPIEAKDGQVMVIGYLTDLPKLERATEIILDSNIERVKRIRSVRSGAALPWGFGKRYFVQMLRLV